MSFIEIKASKKSLSFRGLVCGVGVNDAEYMIERIFEGKSYVCPYYRVWSHMIERCYSIKYQKLKPSYIECSVCDEWLVFSVFARWMKKKDWQGRQLDKDILVQGNKIYSPDTCIFVESFINNLFIKSQNKKGSLPVGVYKAKKEKTYRASCRHRGKYIYLGNHKTPEVASEAYKAFKCKVIAEIAENQDEPLRTALLNYKIN